MTRSSISADQQSRFMTMQELYEKLPASELVNSHYYRPFVDALGLSTESELLEQIALARSNKGKQKNRTALAITWVLLVHHHEMQALWLSQCLQDPRPWFTTEPLVSSAFNKLLQDTVGSHPSYRTKASIASLLGMSASTLHKYLHLPPGIEFGTRLSHSIRMVLNQHRV
ncbi:hypothetical protein [Aliagarivorans taiwanensis]|uniref:hypothetical protein n=1 Tax=Aliagarivorans taiwanensis TaxID=561966 RepID=UPI00047AA178|nr:hypothetical protein [Aliagarivorans taiwanensis]